MFGVVASVAFAAGMHTERTMQIPNEDVRLLEIATKADRLHGISASIDRIQWLSPQYEQLSAVKTLEDVEKIRQGSRRLMKSALMLLDSDLKRIPEQQAQAVLWLYEPRLTELRKRLDLDQ